MPRRPRNVFSDYEYFHITTRGAGESLIFVDDFDRRTFADCFWNAVLGFDVTCFVACQVGTHYHAVVQSEVESLSGAMRKLNGAYARCFNERHGRRGHLFGDRFSSWVIESESHFAYTIPYVLWNPVRAGLCSSPEQWQWSWLSPRLASLADEALRLATGRDSPMGQSLRRVRNRRARGWPGEAVLAGIGRGRSGVSVYREQDEL